jgi:hypothetical protein
VNLDTWTDERATPSHLSSFIALLSSAVARGCVAAVGFLQLAIFASLLMPALRRAGYLRCQTQASAAASWRTDRAHRDHGARPLAVAGD